MTHLESHDLLWSVKEKILFLKSSLKWQPEKGFNQ